MEISIIGGGIGGLCTAIALQKKGYHVKIFEKSAEILPLGAGLALSANAIKALTDIGIAEEIIREGKILTSLSILDQRGKIITCRDTKKLYSKYGVDNFTIHRATLLQILLEKLLPETLYLGHTFKSLKQTNDKVEVEFENGRKVLTDFLIAADGIHSGVRKALVPDLKPRYSGYTCWRAVIDKTPINFMDDNFSETWGGGGRFGIVPLSQNKIYWYACINASQGNSDLKNFQTIDLAKIFRSFHHPINEIISLTNNSQLIHNDIIDLPPLSQFAFGRVVLIGDAAHATTPNMGQGACQAIEDALVISKCIGGKGEVKASLKKFEHQRLKRTRKITETSWRIGKIAQLQNPILCKIRDTALRLLPRSFNDRQLRFLYDIDFNNC